jgi:predicted metal-dependent phosphoesterase TrpH
MLKVELHTHTADDPLDRIPHTARQLIDRAAMLGYRALAITLHDRWMDVGPLEEYAADRGLTLIPGIERTIEWRHVLLLNFSAAAEAVRTFDDLAMLKSREPGLVVAPHPFFPSSSSLFGDLDRHADLFYAVEYNAMYTATLNFNHRAVRWAALNGKPLVGNCDVHRLGQLGTTYSLVEAQPTPEGICEAIKSGKVEVRSHPVSWTNAILTMSSLAFAHVMSRLGYAPGGTTESESKIELVS